VLGLTLLALSGCAVDATDEVTADPAYATETAVLAFLDDWRIEQRGELVAGGAVRIEYAPSRLPQCRGDFNGSPGWTITAYAALDGAAATSTYLAGFSATSEPSEPLVALSQPGDLELWFENTSRWGCLAHDSNFGENYHFTVKPEADRPSGQAVARFLPDGSMQIEGRPIRGGELRIEYDPERLTDCRGDQYGHPAWTITGYASANGAQADSFYVAGFSATGAVDVPIIDLEQSGDLAIWFHNTSRWGCSAYDSADGANYHVAVE
jgi:hypothetical protein